MLSLSLSMFSEDTRAIPPDQAHRDFKQQDIYFMVQMIKVSICSVLLILGHLWIHIQMLP